VSTHVTLKTIIHIHLINYIYSTVDMNTATPMIL
jgi:hypothetical protein